MKYVLSVFCLVSSFSAFADSTAEFNQSSVNSERGTLRIYGEAAESLYDHLIDVREGFGIRRGPGITCVRRDGKATYCSMSVESTGEVEGDAISPIKKLPSVSD